LLGLAKGGLADLPVVHLEVGEVVEHQHPKGALHLDLALA